MGAAVLTARPTVKQREFLEAPERFRAYVGGVGAGKTVAGALEVLRQPAGTTGIVAAPTYPMLRDVALRTLLEIAGPLVRAVNRAEMTVELVNGTRALFRSADNPDALRGINAGWVWLDEGAYVRLRAWDVLLGRLREFPGRAWVTTTPRGRNWIYDRFGTSRPDHRMTIAPTWDNPYLPPSFVGTLREAYTALQQRQEIGGEFVENVGAVFRPDWIEAGRRRDYPDLVRLVIGVDPAGSHRAGSAETGIVVAGRGADGHAYVLEDASGRLDAPQWAARVGDLYDEWDADAVVAERNYGGDMVVATLRAYGGPQLRVITVNASRGKAVRAEPLAAPYEQNRVHHVGTALEFKILESQLTGWDPNDDGAVSPDRMDALVWALTDLLVVPKRTPRVGSLASAPVAGRRIR